MMEIIIPKLEGFMIYSEKNQGFSSGGYDVRWKKKGKIWHNIGHVKNHLQVRAPIFYPNKTWYIAPDYQDAVVVDIMTREKALDIFEYLDDYFKRLHKGYTFGGYKNWSDIDVD